MATVQVRDGRDLAQHIEGGPDLQERIRSGSGAVLDREVDGSWAGGSGCATARMAVPPFEIKAYSIHARRLGRLRMTPGASAGSRSRDGDSYLLALRPAIRRVGHARGRNGHRDL